MISRSLVALPLAATLLASCGIRLPAAPAQRAPSASPHLPQAEHPQEPHVLVWMTADTFHTGMVFPFDWLVESGFVPPNGFGKPRYVAMSWGNQDAYSKAGIDTPWKFIRVICSPTPSVMEIIPVNWNIAEVCPDQRIWRKLVPRERGPALAAFLNHCSVTGDDGRPVTVCPSSWGDGTQLCGRYTYYIPRICNVWTAQTIECLGGDINPWSALTADGLARQIVKPPNDFELIWAAYGRQPQSPVDPQAPLAPPQPGTAGKVQR